MALGMPAFLSVSRLKESEPLALADFKVGDFEHFHIQVAQFYIWQLM